LVPCTSLPDTGVKERAARGKEGSQKEGENAWTGARPSAVKNGSLEKKKGLDSIFDVCSGKEKRTLAKLLLRRRHGFRKKATGGQGEGKKKLKEEFGERAEKKSKNIIVHKAL